MSQNHYSRDELLKAMDEMGDTSMYVHNHKQFKKMKTKETKIKKTKQGNEMQP